jgi:hypothetical protein
MQPASTFRNSSMGKIDSSSTVYILLKNSRLKLKGTDYNLFPDFMDFKALKC